MPRRRAGGSEPSPPEGLLDRRESSQPSDTSVDRLPREWASGSELRGSVKGGVALLRKKLLVVVAGIVLALAAATGARASVRGGVGRLLGFHHEAPAPSMTTDDPSPEPTESESPEPDESPGQDESDDQGENGDDQGEDQNEGSDESHDQEESGDNGDDQGEHEGGDQGGDDHNEPGDGGSSEGDD